MLNQMTVVGFVSGNKKGRNCPFIYDKCETRRTA